jgi:hypothetical protein
MMARTYDPKKVLVTVNGVPLSGFADGDFVSAEFGDNEWSVVTGADGEATRVKMNHPEGTITITLHATSKSNDWLTTVTNIDNLSGISPVAIFIRDTNSGTQIFARECSVQQKPAVTFGRDLSNREWAFVTGRLEVELGGSVGL